MGAQSFAQMFNNLNTQIKEDTKTKEVLTEKIENFESLSKSEQSDVVQQYQETTIVTTPSNSQYTQDAISSQFGSNSLIFIFVAIIGILVVMSMARKFKAAKRASKRRTEELQVANKNIFENELLAVHSESILEQKRLDLAAQKLQIAELEKQLRN